MAQRINISTASAYNFPLNLSGEALYLRIVFNTRAQNWYIDILDSQQLPIELGVKINPYQPLIVYGKDKWLLDGNLFVMATKNELGLDGVAQNVTRDNFGGTNNYQLFYVSRTEYDDFGIEEV